MTRSPMDKNYQVRGRINGLEKSLYPRRQMTRPPHHFLARESEPRLVPGRRQLGEQRGCETQEEVCEKEIAEKKIVEKEGGQQENIHL